MSHSFRDLLGTMPLEHFLQTHWQRRAAVLRGTRLHETLAFGFEEFKRAAVRERWVVNCASRRDGVQHEDLIDPSRIDEQYRLGRTLCARIERHALDDVARELRRSAGYAGGCFFIGFASSGGGGFDLHFDNRAVFLIRAATRPRCAGSPDRTRPRRRARTSFARRSWRPATRSICRPGAGIAGARRNIRSGSR